MKDKETMKKEMLIRIERHRANHISLRWIPLSHFVSLLKKQFSVEEINSKYIVLHLKKPKPVHLIHMLCKHALTNTSAQAHTHIHTCRMDAFYERSPTELKPVNWWNVERIQYFARIHMTEHTFVPKWQAHNFLQFLFD